MTQWEFFGIINNKYFRFEFFGSMGVSGMKKLLLVLFLSGLIFQNSGMYRVSAKKMHKRFQTQFRSYVPAQLIKQRKCVAPIVRPDHLDIFMPVDLFDVANTRHWSVGEKCIMAEWWVL